MPEVRAIAKHVPIPARKVRKVIDQVRGLNTEQALAVLRFMPHAAAQPVYKLVRSAVANAEENEGLDPSLLYIKTIMADEGPGVLPGKGRRPRFGGRSRYRPIRKGSSHITVVVEEAVE